jgi:glucose-1-phosphatase
MHKAIIFDLGRVLVDFDFKRSYAELASYCPHDPRRIPLLLQPSGLVQRFETGMIEPRAFVEELSAILSSTADYETFCRVFNGIFSDLLVPESLVEALAARYRLVLLSNTNAIHFAMLRESYPILRHFHHLVLSYEVKAMKPDPEIYRAAIDRAGCLPGECFYTDDIAEYVESGRRMGLDAEQFQSAEKLERDLRFRGISW